jgi:hypothetical protein
MRALARKLSILALFTLALTSAGRAAVIEVYLQGGQSNADGRAATSGLPASPVNLQQPQADVAFFFHTQGSAHALDKTLTTLRPGQSETNAFGPEITFGRDMADYFSGAPNVSVAIIKYGNGGTNLYSQWKAGGDATTTGDGSEYIVFQNTVTAGLAAIAAANPGDTVVIKGMTWMQGESDNNSAANASAYQTNLTNFIADVRATYGANLPFVIGEIAVNGGNSNTATIRNAQAAVAAADSNTGFVDVDTFSMQDSLHFSPAGQMSLGSGFATQMQGLLIPDTTKPSPDPMTFSAAPSVVDDSSITMTASTASDDSGVEYFFQNTVGGGNDSGWQDSAVYVDTGLLADTEYSYRVKARDKSANQNETGYSVAAAATTASPGVDTSPPSPDPMSFSSAPSAVGLSSITMTAATAVDTNGVEYYFENTAGGGNGGDDSGWQDSAVYTDTDLLAGMEYSYRVKARDKSAAQNETGYSAAVAATTTSAGASSAIISNGDSYIRDSNPTSIYGSDAYMVANDNGSSVRMVIFSFDISSVPAGSITSAKLELDDVVGGASQTYEIWGLLDAHETFDESTLTWNTAGFVDGTDNTTVDASKAYGGTLLGTFNNTANSENTVFDVTSGTFLNFLNASGDNDVTFVIVDPNANGAGSGWATKESSGNLKPTLTLAAEASGYVNWTANYPELDLTDSSADNDLDGLPNLIESWFGTDPGQQDSGPTAVSSSGTTTVFTHPKNATSLSDVQGTYQWSPNLVDWYDSGDGPSGGPTATMSANTVESMNTVTLTTSEETPRVFFRVTVSASP